MLRVVVGEEFALDLAPIAPVLFGLDLDYEVATARMKLATWDPEQSLASFIGAITVRATSTDDNGAGSMILTHTGSIEMRSNPGQNRIEEIVVGGKVEVSSPVRQAAQISGAGTFRGKLTTSIPEDVARLRKARPRFRTTVRRADLFGLQISVPSYWASLKGDGKSHRLVRTIDRGLGSARIKLLPIAEGNADPKEFFRALEKSVKLESPNCKVSKVSCRLGAGRAFTIQPHEGTGGAFIRAEYYPHRSGWLLYRLMGDEKACKKAMSDFLKARRTLKPAKPLF